ncbi:MBL fold metallo-hydrolase [Brevibacillus reuszeri]|uniref:MBL fold metallo-hydrolase n=1 Tax=Brevibacillus reuszeri TaxID=54915 RepID=UPI002899F2E1|nr:MBL fold metallo-hydrolase [Brevibacillus reuszeri]
MRIITLCGSTRFKKQFREVEATLTLQGNIVQSLGFFEQSDAMIITSEQEALFERIHAKKIDMADEILVIDVGGYIGKSTAKEIAYAKQLGKTVRYYSDLSPHAAHSELGDQVREKQEIVRLNDHVLYLPASHETDRPILAAISGTSRTLIMDAGNSPAHAALFLRGLSVYDLPRTELVALTHWHWDHIFGLSQMNLPAIAHVRTKFEMEKLAEMAWSDAALDQRVEEGIEISFCADMIKKELPGLLRNEISIVPPTLVFEDRLEIDLGQVTCILQHVGGDHAQDSIVLYVKETKTLFLGDCLAPDIYTRDWNYSPAAFLELLSKIEAFDADTYVESHSAPMPKSQFQREMNEMKQMAQAVMQNRGDKNAVHAHLTEAFNREWTQTDVELLDYFLNGYR